MPARLIASLLALAAASLSAGAAEVPHLLEAGAYVVTHRLELPHLERWAVDRTTTICLAHARETTTLPILSGGNPFETCFAVNVHQDGARLSYDIKCKGRDAARARATYTVASGNFNGRIAMVMGAKNMTMTEVQAGQRLGDCTSIRAHRD